MKNTVRLFFLLLLFPIYLFSQTDIVKFEKATSFFPEVDIINKEDIEWGYLRVPENWNDKNGNTIKLAVAVLKCTSKELNSTNPVVFIEGGPGANSIYGIWSWLDHPLRSKSDIVLIDLRGTGFSSPKLCPELGKSFLKILSKNQSSEQDETQKVVEAMACKQDLINRGIDISAYNSVSMAKDLNALKKILKYDKWNVISASYGTYIAQVYANDFPKDIKTLIFDSPIPYIDKSYYNHNTSNYMSSLEKVFNLCENNENCNKQYPNLRNSYFEIIEELKSNPITVRVDKRILESGVFTYNVEDFKICVQQALMRNKLIEVTPLLITQFKNREEKTLGALVSAFSGALSLDYGTFYCVICNEALPYNSIDEFNKEALKYNRLKGGLSFYKSDFLVCNKWNLNKEENLVPKELPELETLTIPVIVFSGDLDPVTPVSNGKTTAEKFLNGTLIRVPNYGHGPSFFSDDAKKIVNYFVQNPTKKPIANSFETESKVEFAKNIKISGGVFNFGNSLNEFNPLFLTPIFIAIIILLISSLVFLYSLIRNRKDAVQNKIIKSLIIITSLIGLFILFGLLVALNTTAENNFYILAFGLPNKYSYLFHFQGIFLLLTFVSSIYFLYKIKSISNRSIIATDLFSLVLIGAYFQYWGFFF